MALTTFKNDMRITGNLNVDGAISQDLPAALGVGTGITGTGTIVKTSVSVQGTLIETRILIDLTGLNGGGTAADIIGGDGLANCTFGRVRTSISGTIFAGYMRCLEVPTGSNADVDLYAASVDTGVEDAAVTSLTGQAILLNGGTWTLSLTQALTAYPAANSYLYLASGTATAATFTAGIFEIVLFGS